MSAATTPTSRFERLALRIEHGLFLRRRLWLALFAVISLFLLWQASLIRPDASFIKMVPAQHPYVKSHLAYEDDLRPLSNSVRIVVANRGGDIYSADYLNRIRKITDEVFYVPGVDRGHLRSLTTPNTMWMEASEDGLRSGRVVLPSFAGSDQELAQVRGNVGKAGLVGQLVSNDQRSSIIMVPLLELDPQTGARLDYRLFGERLEQLVRSKYADANTSIHIVGFAKLVGDLTDGARDVALFFLLTVALTTLLVYLFSRCWKSTASVIGCCLLAVVWHMGIMRLLGFGLDPYSMLVPFLTFAIGVSHAMQNVNTMARHSLMGEDSLQAARATFRLLFVPGSVALLCNVVGFSTMLAIDIGVIRELAISASVGVAAIIFTKMLLLPVVMSQAGLSRRGLAHARRAAQGDHRLDHAMAALTQPRLALVAVGLALLLGGWAFQASRQLQIGDLDPGAPELRQTSVYNQDTKFFTEHFATSADVFVVLVETDAGECSSYPVASTVMRLQWALEETAGVQSTVSLFNVQRQVIAGRNGGHDLWATATRNRQVANSAHGMIPQTFANANCSMLPVVAFLADHRAGTLDGVVATVNAFVAANPGTQARLRLASGNAGIEVATNEVVRAAWVPMLLLVYGTVALLLWLEFRSPKAVLCIMVPLVISSLLCEAIMVALGLGVKVATLPVITLGVGIGVDYGIYLYSRMEAYLEEGMDLPRAYFETLRSTGKAIAFTGLTLGAGVLTWVMSDIKFQADMGLLLAFMFVWNMLGAVLLIPALAALLRVRARHQAGGALQHDGA